MKNKSNNSTKTKKKLLPPIKAAKKEPTALKISNKSTTINKEKETSNGEKKLDNVKIPPVRKSSDQSSTQSQDSKKKITSTLPPNTPLKPEVSQLNILEKQKTILLNANAGAFNPDSSYQLDKRQRFEIYKRRLLIKPPAKDTEEAVQVINKTLDEIEEKYAPKKDDKFYALNSKRYGRMWPIPPDRIKVNPATGKTEMLAVGLVIQINKNGGFEVWSVNRGNQQSKRLFFKTGQIKTANTEAESSDNAIIVVNDSSIENQS